MDVFRPFLRDLSWYGIAIGMFILMTFAITKQKLPNLHFLGTMFLIGFMNLLATIEFPLRRRQLVSEMIIYPMIAIVLFGVLSLVRLSYL